MLEQDKKVNILNKSYLGILLFALMVFFVGSNAGAQDIKYNIRGDKNLPVIIPGQAFINKPDFTLEDMKYMLMNTPCSDCPGVTTFNKLVTAYKASNKKQKLNILESIIYFSRMADNGFCPGVPSTGQLKMVLR